MDLRAVDGFLRQLLGFYVAQGRHDMPWRQREQAGPYAGGFDPYKILVSELMLQQTQVARVIPKHALFLDLFPDAARLAAAPLGEVLGAWSGLGYNRRAKHLWQAARLITQEHGSTFPRTYEALLALPGVGPNTAGAILAYAYNEPVVYVETNIRTVIIHHFFKGEVGVADTAIRPIMARLVARADSSRVFYWAMMDYGTHLKSTVGNAARASASFTRQPAFNGSRRQLRGQVIRLLAERSYTYNEMRQTLGDKRAENVLADLVEEDLVKLHANTLKL